MFTVKAVRNIGFFLKSTTQALRLAHVFTHASPVVSMKISPDGQRMAIGISVSGKTIVNDLKTRSIVRSVFRVFLSVKSRAKSFISSVFEDRYLMDAPNIWSVKFSPGGRLLATAGSDRRIRVIVLSLCWREFPIKLDLGYHSKANASHAQRTQQ